MSPSGSAGRISRRGEIKWPLLVEQTCGNYSFRTRVVAPVVEDSGGPRRRAARGQGSVQEAHTSLDAVDKYYTRETGKIQGCPGNARIPLLRMRCFKPRWAGCDWRHIHIANSCIFSR